MDFSECGNILVCFLVFGLAKECALLLGEPTQYNLLNNTVYELETKSKIRKIVGY